MTQDGHRRRPGALGRGYWLIWTAALTSGLGDGLVLVAFPLLASELTDDPTLVAGVAVFARLPWLVLALPAGAVVDRAERRRLLASVEWARVGVLVLFGFAVAAGWTPLALLYVVVFAIGTGQTLFVAGTFATVPTLVASEQLTRANGLLVASETAAANLAGPALGGVLFAAAAALPFLLDGVSFAVSAVLVLAALPRRRVPRATTAPPTRTLESVKQGWRFFRRDPLLRRLALMIAVLAFCQAVVLGPIVLFALDVLGLSDTGFGLFLATAALGNVAGGLLAGRLDAHLRPALLLPLAGAIAALGYAVLGLATSTAAATGGLVLEAVAVAVGNVASLTLRQRMIPAELLGRVGNIFRFFIYGAMPLGALAGGVLAGAVGLRAPPLVAAGLQLALVALLAPALVNAQAAVSRQT